MSTVIPLSADRGPAKTIVREIRVWMTRRDVTQTALAAHLGIQQSQLSRRLKSQVALDIRELERIAEFLDVDPVVFLRPSVVPWPDGGGDDDPGTPISNRQAELQRAAQRHRGHGASTGTHRYAA